MKYQTFDKKSYKIHTIKTDRFKTSRIEVVFRMPIKENNLGIYSFLAGMLNESSKKYPTRRLLAIKCEDLYKTYYYCSTIKVGNVLNIIFSVNFINPDLIDEASYLEDIINFLFEMIMHPNVTNEEFDIESFNIVKNNIALDIDSIEEDPNKKAINNALTFMDENSPSSYSLLGTKEDLQKITPEKLYKAYIDVMNNFSVDIFAIGNLNIEKLVMLITRYYKNHRINDNNFDYYIDNKINKKVVSKTDDSTFLQTQLIYFYNLYDLDKNEKEVTFQLLNYILGSGGLSSKLYKYIREENSFCYRIGSMYFKYDSLLCVNVALENKNVESTIKYIKKAVSEMQNGKFSDEDLKDAKNNLLLALKYNKNNPLSLLAHLEFKVFLDNYDIDERIELVEKVTKNDIVKLAKKIVDNSIYILKEENHEGN